MKEINKRIRSARILAGLTQSEVAERIGKKCSTYSQMERKGEITCEVLIKLSEIFRVDATALLYAEEECPIYKKKPEPEEPEPPKPEPPKIFPELSHKEITLIKMFRYLSHEKRNLAMEYIYKLTKKQKR